VLPSGGYTDWPCNEIVEYEELLLPSSYLYSFRRL
jgi:hypothetical protein